MEDGVIDAKASSLKASIVAPEHALPIKAFPLDYRVDGTTTPGRSPSSLRVAASPSSSRWRPAERSIQVSLSPT